MGQEGEGAMRRERRDSARAGSALLGPCAGSAHLGRAALEWESLDPRTQSGVKVAVLVLATLAAYHYSLATLLSDRHLRHAARVSRAGAPARRGLAWVNRKPRAYEPPIHDRQLDYSIGIPLIVAAVLAAYVLPSRLGAMAWVNRSTCCSCRSS